MSVQFYGAEPNEELIAYLARRDIAADVVMPYVYASDSDEQAVVALIRRIAEQNIDAIAFTSMSQVDRLFAVAAIAGLERTLVEGLQRLVVAAVGPVVADALQKRDVDVDVMPDTAFFMKPLVTDLVARLVAPDS